MDSLPDAPALVLVAITLASALLLIEVALPTFGVAGLSALALGSLAVAMLAGENEDWWPLALCAISVCIWAMLLARRRSGGTGSLVAAALYAVGSATYGALAGDALTVVLGVVAGGAIAAGFPTLRAAMSRLLEGQPHVGMESLVGQRARVVRARGGEGTVRVDGALWTARSAAPLRAGHEAVVVGYEGMTLEVKEN